MPQKPCPDNATQERIEALFEVLGQTQAQILAQLDKIRRENGPLSKELEEKLMLMFAAPALPPYP